MICIIDYGVGNLFSLKSSLAHLGLEAKVSADAADIRAADRLILPGVGAFGDAMAKLEATGLVPVIREEAAKKPLLGICLGMQLLFEKSYEYGEHDGLGFVPGQVCPLAPDLGDKSLKVPQIAGTPFTSCGMTRCSSTSGTASISTTSTATTAKTALPTHWLSATIPCPSPAW